jgi:hypothetical protein
MGLEKGDVEKGREVAITIVKASIVLPIVLLLTIS